MALIYKLLFLFFGLLFTFDGTHPHLVSKFLDCRWSECQPPTEIVQSNGEFCIHLPVPCIGPSLQLGWVKYHSCCKNITKNASENLQTKILESEFLPNLNEDSSSKDDLKIVGGLLADPGQFPYQVALLNGYGFTCGGSIYNENFIITAAHCVYSYHNDHKLNKNTQYSIIAGDHNLYEEEGTEQVVEVAKIIIHEAYDPQMLVNDIALLKLKNPLRFTKYINKIRLPPPGHSAQGSAIVSGWGTTREGGHISKILRYTDVDIIPDNICQQAYDMFSYTSICAGKGNHDSCQGDSGGPLVCNDDDDDNYLCGIVSYGYGCGHPNFPGVYSEVAHFIDWIKDNTN